MSHHILEAEARALAGASASPPLLYRPGVDSMRTALGNIQAAPTATVQSSLILRNALGTN